MFRTSQASLVRGEGPADGFRLGETPGVSVEPLRAEGRKCARSWRILPEVGSDPRYPDLSLRDADAVAAWDAIHDNGITKLGGMALALAAAVVAADQAIKAWILTGLNLPEIATVKVAGPFYLTMVWNPGVSFGFLRATTTWCAGRSPPSRSVWPSCWRSGCAGPSGRCSPWLSGW